MKIRRLLADARKLDLALVLVLSVLGAIAEVASIGAVLPFLALAAGVVDNPAVGQMAAPVRWLGEALAASPVIAAAIILVAATTASAALRLALLRQTQVFVFGLEYSLMVRLYERLIGQSYVHFVRTNSSEALAGLEKVHVVGMGILVPLLQAATATMIAACIAAALIYVAPAPTIAAMAALGGLYLVLSLSIRRKMFGISKGEARDRTERIKLVQETLGGMRDIIVDRSRRLFIERLKFLQADARQLRIRSNFLQGAPRFVVEAAGVAILAGLAIYFDRQPGGVPAALPVLGALGLGAQRLIPLLQQIYLGWAAYSVHHQHLDDVLALMDLPQRHEDVATDPAAVKPFREIRFANVGFDYGSRGDPPALRGVDLTIAAGERIGIVGRTGSGKSTLVDVLMGLLPPSRGALMVDGAAIDPANVSAWQAQVAHVPQSIFLTDGSIADNISFGEQRPVDRERLERSIAQAGLQEFIASLPDGHSTLVGERGIGLSGGQRQRIGIARALYKDAKLLIIDEATSALDDATEAEVMKSIEALGRDRTIVMIAHRRNTLRLCNRIITMSAGGIVPSEGEDASPPGPA